MSKQQDHFPVVVVGAGPTGLTLANLLGMGGAGALLVERNATTVQEPRAVSIDDESLRTMQAAGLIDVVLQSVMHGYGSHYLSPKRKPFAIVEPKETPYGYPRRNAFRQQILEAQLRDGLGRFKSIETLFGWMLETFERHGDLVLLELRDRDGRSRRVSCDLLVGCDGGSSPIREKLGVALDGETFDERWLIVDLKNNKNIVRHTEVYCDARRPCITLPGPEGTRRFEFKLLRGEQDASLLNEETVARLIRDHGADPDAIITRKVIYRFHARVAHQWRDGPVLLAGDAAHLTPPFAGQGMNSGIRDAHNLAWKLVAVRDGLIGPGLLDTYDSERRSHVWQMIRLALRMGRIMAPKSQLHGALTRAMFHIVNLWAPAREYVTQMRYKPPPRFRSGLIVSDGFGRRSMVGRLLPQPRVRPLEGGNDLLLDDMLGQRFALIMYGRAAPLILSELRGAIWSQLACRTVAVLRQDDPVTESHGVMTVIALDDKLEPLSRLYHDRVLLVRPDRYVMATFSVAESARAEAAVAQLVASCGKPMNACRASSEEAKALAS